MSNRDITEYGATCVGHFDKCNCDLDYLCPHCSGLDEDQEPTGEQCPARIATMAHYEREYKAGRLEGSMKVDEDGEPYDMLDLADQIKDERKYG